MARSKSTSGGAAAIGVGLAFLALAAWPSPDGCDLERRLEQDRGEQRFRPRTSSRKLRLHFSEERAGFPFERERVCRPRRPT